MMTAAWRRWWWPAPTRPHNREGTAASLRSRTCTAAENELVGANIAMAGEKTSRMDCSAQNGPNLKPGGEKIHDLPSVIEKQKER